jgi:uncharacterized membrane protein
MAMWPNTIAATNPNGMKTSSPQTKLTMAFPLVCAGPLGACGVTVGAAGDGAAASRPHTRQNLSPAAMLLPQAAQNESICSPGGEAQLRFAVKLDETLHFALRRVNATVVSPLLLVLIMWPTMVAANSMPFSCPDCAVQLPETAAFCPGCGRSMSGRIAPAVSTPEATGARGRVGFFPEPIAGALAYFTFIPAIVFLVLQPYSKNRFVRFHSIQCLLLWVATLATLAALKLMGVILFMIPRAGPLFTLLLYVVVGIGGFVIWLVLIVKALQGQMFKLPTLGDFAEQHAVSLNGIVRER